jgi:hypothetical protein
MPRALAVTLGLALVVGCRDKPPPPSSSPPDQRGELLQRILALDEVAPCLVEAGAAGVRLVDAELAGEAATASFVCAAAPIRGRVTFFRLGGAWKVSTKEISR